MVPCFSWCITIFPSTKSPSFHSLSQKGYLQPLQPWTPGGSRDWIIISSKRAKENCQWPTFSSRCSRDQEFWGHVINIWWLVFFGRNPEKDRKMRYYDVWLPIGQLVGFIALIIYSLICQLNYFRHCSNGDNLHDLAPKITRMGWTSWSSIAAVKKSVTEVTEMYLQISAEYVWTYLHYSIFSTLCGVISWKKCILVDWTLHIPSLAGYISHTWPFQDVWG